MGSTIDSGPLNLAVALAEGISSLPAVATPTWCERAADCLSQIGAGCAAVTLTVVADEMGRIRTVEAAGAALHRDGRARPIARAMPQRPLLTEAPVPDRLRSGAERLISLGWTPGSGALREPSAGFLGELPGGRAWRSGPVGRLWANIAIAEVIVGHVPLPGATGRLLVVHLAPYSGSVLGEAELAVFRAALPLLARRAARALAAGPGEGSGRWLTSREHEILERIILGQSVREIADELGRSPHTVHDYVKSLHRKLGAASRGELVGRALWHGGVSAAGEEGVNVMLAPRPEPHGMAVSMIEASPLPVVPRAAGAA